MLKNIVLYPRFCFCAGIYLNTMHTGQPTEHLDQNSKGRALDIRPLTVKVDPTSAKKPHSTIYKGHHEKGIGLLDNFERDDNLVPSNDASPFRGLTKHHQSLLQGGTRHRQNSRFNDKLELIDSAWPVENSASVEYGLDKDKVEELGNGVMTRVENGGNGEVEAFKRVETRGRVNTGMRYMGIGKRSELNL